MYLGDSTVIGTNLTTGDNWPDYASMFSSQRLRYVANAGVSGNTSAMMLARLQTDVVARKPNVCVVTAGINDLGTQVPFADYQANMREIVRQLRAAGIAPVLTTILPQSNTVLKRPFITKWNLWLKEFANASYMPIVDWYGLMVDPATGTMKTGLDSGDGIHPSAAGYALMGKLVSDSLAPLLPAYSPPLAQAQDANDSANMAPSPMFLTGASGVPDGWVGVGGSSGTFQRSLVADSAINGQWARLTQTADTTTAGIAKAWNEAATAPLLAGGDRILFVVRLRTSALSGGCGYYIHWRFNGAVANEWKGTQPTDGVFLREFTVPAGTTNFELDLKGLAGTGTVDYAQPTIYNLTKLGLV